MGVHRRLDKNENLFLYKLVQIGRNWGGTGDEPIMRGSVIKSWYVVSVGGDGLFNELLSGALLRTQKDAGTDIDDPDSEHLQTPHIRFGIIGAGSANSIVSTVHETTDYATAAVHIAIGIGDGTLDLALVPKISRCHNIQFMRKVAMYGGKGLYQLDRTLNCFRVLRWSFEPDADQEDPGIWNLDGEILEQPRGRALHFRLHPQLISFFGRDAAMVEPSKRVGFVKKRKSSIVYN
ncbi:hypothetical protein TELCIR_01118 [Teladorsagia circumcincta]|uniref:DAGKc domain-containing protein n=1 Tax=Teladorsagia circumcincta TaxID=45464 RepID=A0A2G9V502_TELCI|nr:hypothetical protein TELCIR_01118 [Teladorsagia circumcincta]